MTFTHVLLLCCAGLAACAGLVFGVETLVAFCFHDPEQEQISVAPLQPILLERTAMDEPIGKAA